MRSRRKASRRRRSPVGRLLRHVLAMWLLFCGCEWMAVARVALAEGAGVACRDTVVAACCCCRDGGAESSEGSVSTAFRESDLETDTESGSDEPDSHRCAGDCCVKLAEPGTVPPDALDDIGSDLGPWLIAIEDSGRDAAPGTVRASRAPPPLASPPRTGRRILLETARFRIDGGRRVV
jgi:hypothetical protein